MSDDASIRIPPAAEQMRRQAESEQAHARARAQRSLPPRDPRTDPRTPAEALRAKFAGADAVPGRPQRSQAPQPQPQLALRSNGPRVERNGAVEPPVVRAPKRRPNEYEHEMLNVYRRSGRPVELIMRSGDRWVGELLRFDQYSLIVEIDGVTSVVFKHAVDLVRPAAEEGSP